MTPGRSARRYVLGKPIKTTIVWVKRLGLKGKGSRGQLPYGVVRNIAGERAEPQCAFGAIIDDLQAASIQSHLATGPNALAGELENLASR